MFQGAARRARRRRNLLAVFVIAVTVLGPVAAVAIAADTPFKLPAGTEAPNGWTDANGAFAAGGLTAEASGDNVDQRYTNFGLSIPGGSIIDGITVQVEARSTDSSGCSISTKAGPTSCSRRPASTR